MGRLRGGAALLLGATLLASAWLLATPPLAGPDEAAHLATAAADVRGQLVKPADHPVAYQRVSLPRTYAQAVPSSLCLALGKGPANCRIPPSYCQIFAPGATRCGLPMVEGAAVEEGRTYTGRYPPAYFVAVGWPTLISSAPATLYAVRGLALLLAAALGVSAVLLALRRGRRRLAATAAVMATPMAITTVVAVNPNGLELAGALAMAVGGWLALTAPEVDRPASIVGILGAIALSLSRPLGPFEALAGTVVLAFVAWPRRGELAERFPRRWLALLAVAWAGTLAWIVAFRAFTVLVAPVPSAQRHGRLRYAVEGMTGWPRWFNQAFGDLGYTNIHPPVLATVAWVSVLALLVIVAFTTWRSAPRGNRLALLVSLAWSLLTPAAMAFANAKPPTLFYFGRYGLVPILFAVVACLGIAEHRDHLPRGLPLAAGLLLAVANLATLVGALHYWTVGPSGPAKLTGHVPGWWQPPLSAYGVLAVALLGLGLLGLGASRTRPLATDAPRAPR